MGMQLPEWVRTMFMVTTGDGWPEADEDGLRALAREWSSVAEVIDGLEQRLSEPVLVGRRGGWGGPAADSYTAAQLVLAGPRSPQLTALGTGSRELSTFIDDTSASVEYMKLIVAGQLVILAGQIAYMASMAVSTFGASAAGIPAVQAAGRAFAVTAVRQLVTALAVGEVLQVGLDASIQALQKFALHTRREWDESLTINAAITGAVGAALGPALGALGSVASRAVSQAVGKTAAEAVEQIGVSAVHEYATAVGTGLVTGQGYIGKPWDLTAGATDGATDAAGHLLRRRRGGAAPDVSTLPDITVPVTPVHYDGAPQTVPSANTSPGSPATGGSPTSPATTPVNLGEARPVAVAAPATLDPAELPATADPGDSAIADPGNPASGAAGDPAPAGPGGPGVPDDQTGTAAPAMSAPALDQSPPPILTRVMGAGAPTSESAPPSPRRRTPDSVTSTTDTAVADSATDEAGAPQSPTRRAQPVRRAAEQRDEAAVSDVDEKIAVPVGEAVSPAGSADLANSVRESAWTGSSESAPSSPSAARSASERGDDLSASERGGDLSDQPQRRRLAGPRDDTERGGDREQSPESAVGGAEVTAASVEEVVSQTPDEIADQVKALQARLWASDLRSPLIWPANSESDGDFSDGESSPSDPGMPILDSQLRTDLWRVYRGGSTELAWSGAAKSASSEAAAPSVQLSGLTATADTGPIIKAVRDLPPLRRADAVAWLTTRRAELRQRRDELMEQLGGRFEHPIKKKIVAKHQARIATLNNEISVQEQRLAKLEAELTPATEGRDTDVQGLLANLYNVRTSLRSLRSDREFLLLDLEAMPLRDELAVVRREAQCIDSVLPAAAQLLVAPYTHDLVYVADADVIVEAIKNRPPQPYAYAIDWLGTRRRELHQALTALERQLDPDTIQRLNVDYADLRQIDLATALKDKTTRAYLERVLLRNESVVVDQVLSELVRPTLAHHQLTFVRVEPGSDSLWNSVIAVADKPIQTKLETHDPSRKDSVKMLSPDLIRQFVADQVQSHAPAALVALIRSGDAENDAGAIVKLVASELDLSLKLVENGQDLVLDPGDGQPLLLIRHGNDFCAAIPDDTVAQLDRELTAHRDRLLRAKLDKTADAARRRLIDANRNISNNELQTLRNLLRSVAIQSVPDQAPSGDRQKLDAESPVARVKDGLESWRVDSGRDIWRVHSGRLRRLSWSDDSSSDGEESVGERLSWAVANGSANTILDVVRKSSTAERVDAVAWLSNRREKLGQRLEKLAEQVGRYAEQGFDRGGFDEKYVTTAKQRIAELKSEIGRREDRLKTLEGFRQDAEKWLNKQGGGSATTAVGGNPAMAKQWQWEWEWSQQNDRLGHLRAQLNFHQQDLQRAPLRAKQATVREELRQINFALPGVAEMLVDGQMNDLVFVADVDVISEAIRTLPGSKRGRVSDWLGTRRRELGDRLTELERGLDLGVERRFEEDFVRFWELTDQLAELVDGPERAQVEQELATLAPYVEWARACHEVYMVDQVLNGMIQPYLSNLGLTLVRVQPGPDSLWNSLITVADEQIRATLGSAYLGPRPGAVSLRPALVRGFVADGLPAEASAELVARVRSGDAGDQAGRIVELAARDLGLALTVVDHRPATTMDPQDGVPAHLLREGNDFSAMVPTSTIDRLDAELAEYRERLAGDPRFTKLDEQIGVVRGQLIDANGVVSGRLLLRQRDLLRAMAELDQTRSAPYAPSVETLVWHMAAYTAQVKDIVALLPSKDSQQAEIDAATLEQEFGDLRSQLGDGRDADVVDRMDETVETMRLLFTWLREATSSSTRDTSKPAFAFGIDWTDWHWSKLEPELANETTRERFWSALRLEPSRAVVVETRDGTKLLLRAKESDGVPVFVIDTAGRVNTGPGTPTSVPLPEIAQQLRDRGVERGRLPVTEQQLTLARYCSGDPDVRLTVADKASLIDQFLDRGTARDQDAVVNLLWFSDNADLAALFNPQGFGKQPSDQDGTLATPSTSTWFRTGLSRVWKAMPAWMGEDSDMESSEDEGADEGYPFLNRLEERIVGDAGGRLAAFLAARFEGGRAQLREGVVVPRGNPPARVDPLSLGERAAQRLHAAVDDAGTVSAALQHEPAGPSRLDHGPRDGSLRRFDRFVAPEPLVETHIVRLPETEHVRVGNLQAPGVSSGSAALSARGLMLAQVELGSDSLWDNLIVVADEQIRATLGSAYLGPRPGAVALYPELVRTFVADRLPAEESAELVARVRSGDAGDQAGRIMELAARELGLALTVIDGDHETLVGRQDGVPAYLVREWDDFSAAIPASTIDRLDSEFARLDSELAGYRASLVDPDLFTEFTELTELNDRFRDVRKQLVDDGVVSGPLLQRQRGLLRAMAGLVQILAAHNEPNVENLSEQMEHYTAEFRAIVATVPDEGRRGRLQDNVDNMKREFDDARSAANGTDAAALEPMISKLRQMQRFVMKLGIQQALSESHTTEQARRNEFGVHPVQPDQVRSDDPSQMDDGAEAGPVRRVHRAEVPRPTAETRVVRPPETGHVTPVDPQGWAASSSAAAAQSHAPVSARAAGVADTHVLDQALVLPIVLADPDQPGPDDSRMALHWSQLTGIPDNQWESADVAERARLLCDAVERQQIDSARKLTTGAGATSWLQLLGAPQHSGHKLHVAAGNLAEVRDALRRIAPVLLRAGLGVAVARREDVLWDTHGLGLTISLPRRATIHRDVSLVAAALAGYQPSVAKLAGETQLAPGLFHRFEFGWDPGIDFDKSTTENERRYRNLMYARRPDGAPLADRLTEDQVKARREHLRQKWRLDDNDLRSVGDTVGNPTSPWPSKSQGVLRLEVAGLYCALYGRPELGPWNVAKLLELRRVSEWIRKNYPQAAAQPTVPLTDQDLKIVVRQVVEPGAKLTSKTVQALADLVHKYPRGSVAELAEHARRDAEPEFRRNVAVAVNRRYDALQQALSVPGSPIAEGYTYTNEDVEALAHLVVDKYLDPRANPHDDRFHINDYRQVVRDLLGTTRPTVQDLAALADLVHLVRTGQVRSVPDRAVTVSNLRRATAEWPLQPAHQRRLHAEPIEVEMRKLTRRMYARLAGDAIEQTRQSAVRQQFAQVMAAFYDTRARLNTVDPDDAGPLLTELSRGVQRMQDLMAGRFEPSRQAVNQRLPFDPDDLRQRLETAENTADIAAFVTGLSSPDRDAAMTWLDNRRIALDSEAAEVQKRIGIIEEARDTRNGAAETEQDLYDPLEQLLEDSQTLDRDRQKLDDVLSHLNGSPLSESPGRTTVSPPARPLPVGKGAGAGQVRRVHRAEIPQPMVETHTIRPPETGKVFVGSQESMVNAASHLDDTVAAVQPLAGAERQAVTSQRVARLTELRQEIAELDDAPAIRDGRFDALYVAELTDDSTQAYADAERLAAEIGKLRRQLRELDAATRPGGNADGGPDTRESLRQKLQSLAAQHREAQKRWGDKQDEILLTEARRIRSELQYEADVISAELTALGGPIGEIADVPQPVVTEPESPRGLPSDTEQQLEPESDEEFADVRQRIAALRLVDPIPAVDRTESDSHRDGDETVFSDEDWSALESELADETVFSDEDWSALESELADETAQEQFESATVTEPYAPGAEVSERIDAYLQGYAQLRDDLGVLALSEPDVRTVAGALAQSAGGGFAGDPAQVFDNGEIGMQLSRIAAEVVARGRGAADRGGLRSTLNLLLLSAAWVPVEAGTGRTVPVVSGARLVQVLRDVADDLTAGRDPMVAGKGSRSPLAVIGDDQSRPVAERLARLALLNLDPAVAAGVARNEMFGRLLGSGLADEALYATSGVEQPLALQTKSLAPVSRAVRGQVPTIIGLVAVGQRMVDEIAARLGHHESARESVVSARHEFTRIEAGAREVVERFEVDGDRKAARRALDALTTRWRVATLKLPADVSAVLSATDCARAAETALASPLLSGWVVLTPEVATAEAASRLWAAVYARPGQGMLVESGKGVHRFLGARIVDGASVFVLEDAYTNRSETFTLAQARQGLADSGIVAGYLHSPQWELADRHHNGGSAVELPLDTKAVLIHELLERGLSKDQRMAMTLLETSYDEEIQALLPQEDVLLVGSRNNDERMAQILRETSNDQNKKGGRLRKKSAQPLQVEATVSEMPALFAQLDSAITDSSAAARLRSFLKERIEDDRQAADGGELKVRGYPQWRFGPRALSERLDLRYGTDRWRQVLTDALGRCGGEIDATEVDTAAQYVADQVAEQMMTTSMFERVDSLSPAERTLAVRWLWQERELALQDAQRALAFGEDEGSTPLQISDEMLRSVGLNPDWVDDQNVRTPLVHRPLNQQELDTTIIQEMADRFLAIDQYRHQVADHLRAVLADLGTITDGNLQTAAVLMDRGMNADFGPQVAAELQALPAEPRARVIGWLTAHREQLAVRAPAAQAADEILVALGLRDPLGGETAVAPTAPGPSIADRLRGLVAVHVSADQRLFAPPSWAELRRTWEQRATAQPPDLEAEGEFHATGYSAEALTPEQAAALSAGQVITLSQPVSVVPRQGDLPPDSPVVVEIQGRVTVTPMGSVVQPGRLYEVVSVEHRKDATENQGTREWTFVQLREREV